jgi:N4-bis(aminopropyl)spermidine synthase
LAEQRRIVREVADAVGLAEGERGVRSVLAAVARLEPISTRRLSRAVDLPVPIVASICGELRKRAVVAEERPTRLTRFGRRLFASGALGVRRPATCPKCQGRGVVVRADLAPLLADMRRISRLAPPPRADLDQCHCTAETKLRRVLALHEADALVGRRVLILGDDDLTSLAIAAVVRQVGSDSSIASLTVIDVDRAVVTVVEQELTGVSFATTALCHDLRERLPGSLRGRFDTVFTDPPYTVAGAGLFLSRAAEALDTRGGDVFFSFGSRRTGAALRVQKQITRMGFAIVRLVRDFNEYEGAGVLGGTSSLYHLTSASELRPPLSGSYDGPLYTADAEVASGLG